MTPWTWTPWRLQMSNLQPPISHHIPVLRIFFKLRECLLQIFSISVAGGTFNVDRVKFSLVLVTQESYSPCKALFLFASICLFTVSLLALPPSQWLLRRKGPSLSALHRHTAGAQYRWNEQETHGTHPRLADWLGHREGDRGKELTAVFLPS